MKATRLAVGAIVAGVLAAIGCELYLSWCERSLQSAHAPIDLLIARRAIAAGEKLRPADVEVARLAKQLVPQDVLTPADVVLLDGAHARRELAAGSAVCATDLAEAGRVALSHRITPTRRAMTVPVSKVTSVANMIGPGDHVDILVVGRAEGRASVTATPSPDNLVEAVLENVEVLAVGANLDPTTEMPRDYDSVTIHVTTDEANRVLAAMTRRGSWEGLTLLLRSAGDEAPEAR